MTGKIHSRLLRLGGRTIPYWWGWNLDDNIASTIQDLDADHFFIVSDKIVSTLYAARVMRSLAAVAPVTEIVIEGGETAKNWSVLGQLCENLVASGATRKSCVVALGGGVVGNVAGLAAALLYRGVRLIHFPTTLMAAFDSVISLKQAVNSTHAKNQFGAYHAPTLIFADLAMFETLPEREFMSGVGEVVKNTLVVQPLLFLEVMELISPRRRREMASLERIFEISVEAKLQLMHSDPEERGSGLLLEYGHTLGHAIEYCDALTRGNDGMSHGEAVCLGMLAAAAISESRWESAEGLLDSHRDLLAAAGIAQKLPTCLDFDAVLAIIKKDNKRGYVRCQSSEVAMVLLKDLGTPLWNGSYPLTPVPLNDVAACMNVIA